jgi:hypothetical protein
MANRMIRVCFRHFPWRALALAIPLVAGLLACGSSDTSSSPDSGSDSSAGVDAAGGPDSTTDGDAAAIDSAAAEAAADTGLGDTESGMMEAGSPICLAATAGTMPGCCAVETPTAATIVPVTPPGNPPSQYSWGPFNNASAAFSGYSYTYAGAGSLTSDVTGGTWHLSGGIADYSGFGLGLNCMVDASAYSGIQLTIGGSIAAPTADGGTASHVTFYVSTAATDVSALNPVMPGYARCIPVNNQYDGTCANARITINVSDAATTYSLRWSDFAGGRTVVNGVSMPSPLNPAEITRLFWVFDWPVTNAEGGPPTSPDGAAGYPVDVTIADISFWNPAAGDGGTNDGGPPDGSLNPADASTDRSPTEASPD